MNKYQLVLRCKNWRCDHHRKPYKRTVYADSDEAVKDVPNPPCPKCSKKPKREDAEEQSQPALPHTGMEGIVASGSAPGIIGANNTVKAIDKTAEIVMQDYGLTDLKSNIRPGESMTPRLPAPMQRQADNFFAPGAGAPNKAARVKMQRLGQRAIQGAFRNHAVDVKSVLPDARVALRKSGTEAIN